LKDGHKDSFEEDKSDESQEDDFPIQDDLQIENLVQKIKNMTVNNNHNIQTPRTKKEK